MLKTKLDIFREGIEKATNVFLGNPIEYLNLEGLIYFIGDIHGDEQSFLKIMLDIDFNHAMQFGRPIYIVMLGDVADKGRKNMSTAFMSLMSRYNYPNNFFWVKGNHEEKPTIWDWDFRNDMEQDYGSEGLRVLLMYAELVEKLPTILVINNQVACVHAGPPRREIFDMEELLDKEILRQMRWAEPAGFNPLKVTFPSKMGFDERSVMDLLDIVGAKFLITGHRVFDKGYEIYYRGRMLSIISTGGKSKDQFHLQGFINSPKIFKWNTNDEIKIEENKSLLNVW